MKKILFFMVSCMMVISLIIASCGEGEEEEEEEAPEAARTYGTLRVASEDFMEENFDPNNNGATWSQVIYDTLMEWTSDGGLFGEAAESWTISPDGRTWTFKVRKGMTFHNGDPVTSADFAYSIDRFMDPESTNAWAPRVTENYESSSTPDEYTYVHTTKTPELTLVASWAAPLPILPSKYIQENGWDYFLDNPVGSGPWKYVELIPETSMEYEANTDYWDGAPYFEKLIFYQVPEEATRVAMLKRDEVDLISVTMDKTVELRDEGYRLQELAMPTITIYAFQGTWMTDEPTKDIRVRQAMSYAINRQEVCDTYFHGLGKNSGCYWFMSDVTWGWNPSWKPEPYDTNKATQLLEEAGYPDAFADPTVHVYTPEYWSEEMLICQGYWEAVGLDVEVQIVETGKFYDLMFTRADSPDAECVGQIWPWRTATVNQNVYHSSNMFTSLGAHTTANDPEMDALYDAVLAETDLERQEQLWTEFIQKGRDMWIVTGLWEVPSYWVVGPHLGEFTKRSHLSLNAAVFAVKHAEE